MRHVLMAAALFSMGYASQAVQSDWSGGPSSSVPVSDWSNGFSSSSVISWAAIPGQVQLSSVPLDSPVEHLVFSGIAKPYCADIGDINGDGFNDIVMGAYEAGVVHVYYGSTDGTWTDQLLSGASPHSTGIKIADLNGDYLPDIAVCAGPTLQLFYNDGESVPSWEQNDVLSGFFYLHEVEAVDMDGDGDNDLVAADCDGDRLLWLGNGGESFPEWTDHTIDAAIDYPCKVHPVDLNQDGNMDVVCAAWTGDMIRAYYGSGGQNPSWSQQTIDDAIPGAHGTRACDMDGDGDIDVLGASMDDSQIYLYRNGGGTPISWTRESLGPMAYSAIVRTGDIDGDGDQDVLSSSFYNGGVAWFENTENGTVFIRHNVKVGGQSTSWTMAGDLDGDGDLDVLAVRYVGNSMYWYEVTGFQPEGSLDSHILDTGGDPQWASLDWNAEVPASCSLTLQFRSSDDPSVMGEWSGEYSTPVVLSGLVHRFFQYRMNMSSSDPDLSAIVGDIELNWDPQGIQGSGPARLMNYHSPCFGSFILAATEEVQGAVEVKIYSFAGRLLLSRSVDSGEVLALEGRCSGTFFFTAENSSGDMQSGSAVLLSR